MDTSPPPIVLSHASDSITTPAEPENLMIGLSTTALVVIDMQNAYLSKGGYLDRVGFDVSTSAPVIDNQAAVVAAARGAGMFVIHLQKGFDALQTEARGPMRDPAVPPQLTVSRNVCSGKASSPIHPLALNEGRNLGILSIGHADSSSA